MTGAKIGAEAHGGARRGSKDNDAKHGGARRGSKDNDANHGGARRGSKDNDHHKHETHDHHKHETHEHHNAQHHHEKQHERRKSVDEPKKKPGFIKSMSGSFRLGAGRRMSATQGIVGNHGMSSEKSHDAHPSHNSENDNPHVKKEKGHATAHGHDRLAPPEGYDRRYNKEKDANGESEHSIHVKEARQGGKKELGGKKKKPGLFRQMSEHGKAKVAKLKKGLGKGKKEQEQSGNYATNQSYSSEERNAQHRNTAGAMVVTIALVVGGMVLFL